ncbi:unnamed protein product [Ambrosiozyma monospora]|uniref:Unnamed protein product n=1 Tax=Ambrosiozyma monospora TaxID=43982 RepID=A0ACB5SZH2_AMBMO|nr:unnamed protein product [Ambrosiozyma monospora]
MTSESLFDNTITNNESSEPVTLPVSGAPTATASASSSEELIPSDVNFGNTLITYRVLVSRREAGAIIGRNGDNIAQIRDSTDIKAAVSKVVDGCMDRILTVTGIIDKVSHALVAFASSVTEANTATVRDAKENNADPTPMIAYNFFPLRALNPPPPYDDEAFSKTLSLRLLVPHSQMGTLIGKGGARIKFIQETFNVRMVASKEYLKNSTERVVEIQGFKENVEDALSAISKCLLRDYHGVATTLFYVPSPRQGPSRGGPNSRPPRNGNGGREITETVRFPGDYVGALIGKKGSRIQEVRRSTSCSVNIDPDDDENGDRIFTLTGNRANIDRALSYLQSFYEKEQHKRAHEDSE